MNIVKMNRVPGEPWGFHLHEVGQARTIARVDPGSVSSREGQLQVGMAVLRIGDEAVDGMPMVDLAKLVRDGGDVITLTLTAAAAKTTAQPRRTAVPNPAMTVAVPRGEGWQQLPSGKLAHPGGTWVFDGSTQTTYLLQHLGFRETGPQFCERFTDHIIRAAQLSTGNCIAGQLVPNANPRDTFTVKIYNREWLSTVRAQARLDGPGSTPKTKADLVSGRYVLVSFVTSPNTVRLDVDRSGRPQEAFTVAPPELSNCELCVLCLASCG